MAAYNGEKYIEEQIESILEQLIDGDEFIIIDDNSTDSTFNKIAKYGNKKIKYYLNDSNIGHNKSFEKAIKLSSKEYIFLVDQDDIWIKKRIDIMMNILINNDVVLVTGNQLFIDKNGNKIDYSIESLRNKDSNYLFNSFKKIFLGKSSYYGCAMAFKSELKKLILPFPFFIESHDLWIAKSALLYRKNYHLEEPILLRRIHGKNSSINKRKIIKKIWSRVIFIISIIYIFNRIRIVKYKTNI